MSIAQSIKVKIIGWMIEPHTIYETCVSRQTSVCDGSINLNQDSKDRYTTIAISQINELLSVTQVDRPRSVGKTIHCPTTYWFEPSPIPAGGGDGSCTPRCVIVFKHGKVLVVAENQDQVRTLIDKAKQ